VVFAMRLSRTLDGVQYLSSTAVFFAEILKMICSWLFFVHECRSFGKATHLIWLQFTKSPFEVLKVCVPAFLYTLQNNLLFISLSHLSGAVYQVTYQLKILTTAVLSGIILRKTFSLVQWMALLLLTAGVAFIQVPREQSTVAVAKGNPIVGLIAVSLQCVTSGLAGVYLEKILKQTDASIWLRNIQLGAFGIGFGLFVTFQKDGELISKAGFTQGYSGLVWCVIFLQAVGGLVVAAVLKYADNILKCFGNAVSIILSCLLSSVLLMEFVPDMHFVLGTMLVIVATTMYTLQPSRPSRPSKPTNKDVV